MAVDALERIEMALRVDVAHLLGERDPQAHQNSDCLHGNFAKKKKKQGKTGHQLWLEKFANMLYRARREPFITHHKNQIADKYGLAEGKTLAQWLRSLNFIRNVSAHHSRLWNINVLELSPCPQGWPTMENTRLFMYFAIMAHLLAVICPNSTWAQRLVDLLREGVTTSSELLKLEEFGAFEGWEPWLLKGQK